MRDATGERPTLPNRRERSSAGTAIIGELNERSLHRALKARYAVAGSATEQAVDGFVADVVAGGRIVEVHTGSFRPLKRKLPRLLERHPVTLVHPVARDRYIVKVPADPNAPPSRRKSPKHGSVFEVFPALASIPALLAHPNLTLEVVMTVEDEVRAKNGRGSWRRRGWAILDRRLVEVVETCTIASMGRPVRPARRRSARAVHDPRPRGGHGVAAAPR